MLVLQIMTLKIPNKFFIPSQIAAPTSHTITLLDACVYLYWYTAGCTLQAVTSSAIYLLFFCVSWQLSTCPMFSKNKHGLSRS